MSVVTAVVPRDRIRSLWPLLAGGLAIYREKSPHEIPKDEALLQFLESPDGDELLIAIYEQQIIGFLTFKVQRLNSELWGTIAIIYIDPMFQGPTTLPAVTAQLEEILRQRGCNVMNYMTARKGFAKLAPRLGFRPRITEWMKEI